MTQYQPSPQLKAAIKQFEGCQLKAYVCPAGKLTIGYGHTSGVRKNQVITQTMADKMLDIDLQEFCSYVNRLSVCKTQGQFDALVDFCFNLGTAALSKSTLLAYIREGRPVADIQKQFNRWVYSGKEKLPGLVRRRAWEAQRYAQ